MKTPCTILLCSAALLCLAADGWTRPDWLTDEIKQEKEMCDIAHVGTIRSDVAEPVSLHGSGKLRRYLFKTNNDKLKAIVAHHARSKALEGIKTAKEAEAYRAKSSELATKQKHDEQEEQQHSQVYFLAGLREPKVDIKWYWHKYESTPPSVVGDGRTQYVGSYYRDNGTFVNSYFRRPAR